MMMGSSDSGFFSSFSSQVTVKPDGLKTPLSCLSAAGVFTSTTEEAVSLDVMLASVGADWLSPQNEKRSDDASANNTF